jgi:hypothetical protein
MDGFLDVAMNRVQIMPVMYSIGDGDPGNKRQTHRKNSNDNRFIHKFSLQLWTAVVDYGFPACWNIRHSPRPQTACQKETRGISVTKGSALA